MKTLLRSSRKAAEHWLLPEASGWTSGPLDGAGRIAVPAPEHEAVHAVVWPLAQTVGLPVWLVGGDAALFPAAVALEWEKQGLLPRHYHVESLVVRVVAQEAGRTLVLPLALARQARGEEMPMDAERYVSLLDALEWPPDRLVLFRELGSWVAVVTRDSRPVHFSSFFSQNLPEHAGEDLASVLEALAGQGIIQALQGVVLWESPGPPAERMLREVLGLPVAVLPRPAWQPAATAPALLHPVTVAQRLRQQRFRKVRQLALAAAVLVLSVMAWAAARTAWAEWQVRTLAAELKAWEIQAAPVRAVALRWRQVEPTIDPTSFPLEHLRRVAELLPTQGVRLTEFQCKDGQIRLTGEAQDTSSAFAFAERLREFDAFAWELEPPIIQPNNSAQFVVKGRTGP